MQLLKLTMFTALCCGFLHPVAGSDSSEVVIKERCGLCKAMQEGSTMVESMKQIRLVPNKPETVNMCTTCASYRNAKTGEWSGSRQDLKEYVPGTVKNDLWLQDYIQEIKRYSKESDSDSSEQGSPGTPGRRRL